MMPDTSLAIGGGRTSGSASFRGARGRWYVVQTRPNKESLAERELLNQGYGAFYPRRLKTRRHARKIQTVLAPLFPSYIFVQLDLESDRWRSVNGTRGVARIVAFDNLPTAVPDGLVDALRAGCDDSGVLNNAEMLVAGRRVRIVAGPFADFIGTLERLDGNRRAWVLLEIMGRQLQVVVPCRSVSA